MKNVLILGGNGAFGRHCLHAFVSAGWQVTALVRTMPPSLLRPSAADSQNLRYLQGELFDNEVLNQALAEADVVIYAINPANYRWKNRALPWLKYFTGQLQHHSQQRPLTVVLPDNIYTLSPENGPYFQEDSPLRAQGSRSQIRLEMLEHLKACTQDPQLGRLRVIAFRMGDFIAPNTPSSWLNALLKQTQQGYTLSLPGPADIAHTWAYLPDATRTLEQLLQAPTTHVPETGFHVFHYGGYHVDWPTLQAALAKASQQSVKTQPFPWHWIRLGSPFSMLLQGLNEMRYLWQHEMALNDQKLKKALPQGLEQTPLEDCLKTLL